MDILFKREKDCKHSVRFMEVNAGGEVSTKPVLRTIYVQRAAMTIENGFNNLEKCDTLTVSIVGR